MPEAFWAEIGPWGLVSIFVIMIFSGLLVPRWTHKQRMSDRDKVIELQQKALDKRDAQVDTLIDQNEVIVRAIEDLKHEASRSSAGRHGTAGR